MASPRCAAPSSLTRCPSIRISPDEMSSSPAIMRRSVDLPQPDGPTKTQNSPCSARRSTPCTTSASPKRLITRSSSSVAMLLDARARDPGRDVALQEGEDEGDRQEREHGHREQVVPLGRKLAAEGVERQLERELLAAGQHDQRPEKIVPAPHDGEDREHGKRWRRKRQDDA